MKLLSQSDSYFIKRDEQEKIDSINFQWNDKEDYRYLMTYKTLRIEGKDTLKDSEEVDTLSFKVINFDNVSLNIRAYFGESKLRKYLLLKYCKTDSAFSNLMDIDVDLSYNYVRKDFILLNCEDVRTLSRKIANFNIDCKYEDNIDRSIHEKLQGYIDNCKTLTNWFTFDLQFLFTYDGYLYPQDDSIYFSIVSKNIDGGAYHVNLVSKKEVLENSDVKYTIREDLNIEESFGKRLQKEMLKMFKAMMPNEKYKEGLLRIEAQVEDNSEYIILDSQNALLSYYKYSNSMEDSDGVKKISRYYTSLVKLK